MPSLCDNCIFCSLSYSVCGATGKWRGFSRQKKRCEDFEPVDARGFLGVPSDVTEDADEE